MPRKLWQKRRLKNMRKIKFLLDADMPRSSAEVIRSLGYEVEDVRDIGLGAAKDREIIEYV